MLVLCLTAVNLQGMACHLSSVGVLFVSERTTKEHKSTQEGERHLTVHQVKALTHRCAAFSKEAGGWTRPVKPRRSARMTCGARPLSCRTNGRCWRSYVAHLRQVVADARTDFLGGLLHALLIL